MAENLSLNETRVCEPTSVRLPSPSSGTPSGRHRCTSRATWPAKSLPTPSIAAPTASSSCSGMQSEGNSLGPRVRAANSCYYVHHLGWVGLTCILSVPLSAQLCLGLWEFGRSGGSAWQDGGTHNSKSSQPNPGPPAVGTPCRYVLISGRWQGKIC